MRCLQILSCIAGILFWIGNSGTGQGADDSGKHEKDLRFEFAVGLAELAKPIQDLERKYLAALRKQEEKAKAEGDLEATLAVREEIEGFRIGPAKSLSASDELRQLRGIFDRERPRLLENLNAQAVKWTRQYQSGLEEKVKALTRADKIDEALRWKKEIEQLDAVLLASPDPGLDLLHSYVGNPELGLARAPSPAAVPSPVVATPGVISGSVKMMGQGMTAKQVIPPEIANDDRFVSVKATWGRWMALRNDGSVVVFPSRGANVPPADLKPAVRIEITQRFNLAFHADQTFTVWGTADNPAKDLPPADLGEVLDLVVDGASGIALLPNGRIRIWGSMYPDEKTRKEIESGFRDVEFIGGSGDIAWLAARNGDVFSWDKNLKPQKAGSHRNIRQFDASAAFYIALDGRGKVSVGNRWARIPQQEEAEKLSGVQRVATSWAAFACQLQDGSWRSFGTDFSELHQKVESLGPVKDLAISTWTDNGLLVWLE